MNFECNVCGYIYDSRLGEPRMLVPPGTEFENAGPQWECPLCASPARFFTAEGAPYIGWRGRNEAELSAVCEWPDAK